VTLTRKLTYVAVALAALWLLLGVVTFVQNLIVAVHGRSEHTPELEQASYGRPFDPREEGVWANAAQQ